MGIKTDSRKDRQTAKEMFEAISRGTVTQEQFAAWYRGRSILCFKAGRKIERQEWEQSYRFEIS